MIDDLALISFKEKGLLPFILSEIINLPLNVEKLAD
jgi:hypothetical protein